MLLLIKRNSFFITIFDHLDHKSFIADLKRLAPLVDAPSPAGLLYLMGTIHYDQRSFLNFLSMGFMFIWVFRALLNTLVRINENSPPIFHFRQSLLFFAPLPLFCFLMIHLFNQQ